MKENLAILISGNGSTMEAIIKAKQNNRLNLDIACIISSNPDADGIQKAKKLGIPEKDILIIPRQPIETFGQRLLQSLQVRGVTLVSQNGWLPLTPEKVIEAYKDKIFNQHPGDPNRFGGKGMYGIAVYQAAINYYKNTGEDNHCVIIQKVSKNFDEGQIVKSTFVKILPNDTPESLQERCLPIEHETVVSFLENFSKNY